MEILITGASSRLGRALASELGEDHHLRLMDRTAVELPGSGEFFRGDILNPDDAAGAAAGMDAVIHTGEPPPDLPADDLGREQALIDLATRGTHVLTTAAVKAGIRKFVYAGSLAVLGAYPDDVYISEAWKPLPTPEVTQMSKYLGELTCREFARVYPITVTCLRLGELVLEEETRGQPTNLLWVDLRDAAQAFRCALNIDKSQEDPWTRRWAIYHICADIPNPKYLIARASGIGYKPTHNFLAHRVANS